MMLKGLEKKSQLPQDLTAEKKETETDPDLQIHETFAHLGNDLVTKPPRGILFIPKTSLEA